jgi:hypothetical protein
MSYSNTIQIEKQEDNEARQSGGIKRFFMILGLTLVWAFLSAMIVGSFAAAIWAAIPTVLLPWDASYVNLIGYVSHCPFTPASTLILLCVAFIGVFFSHKLKKGRSIGQGVFAVTLGGLLIGLFGGIDIIMFMGMGAGVGVGVLLGLIIGLVRQAGV